MLNKRSVHILFAILLVLGLAAAVIQAAPANQLTLTSPLPGPDPFDSPLPPPLLCPTTTNRATLTIEVDIEGLEGKYPAEVQLLADTAQTTACLSSYRTELPHLNVRNGRHSITVIDIPDGFYKLAMNAPAPHFRDPAGYLFQVQNGQIVRRPKFVFQFRLVPPSAQALPPCREFERSLTSVSEVPPRADAIPQSTQQDVCWAERTVDISSPPKQPERAETTLGILNSGYHYIGPVTTQNNQGVWGRNTVVDANVPHPGPAGNRFVVERVYADNGDRWMEAGWAEVSWRDDRQYIYEYDYVHNVWTFFDEYVLVPGSQVETDVQYDANLGMWKARYYLGGNYWRVLAMADLGVTVADRGFNRGEVFTADGVHPILPLSGFDKGYLLIDGAWRFWDDRYSVQTRVDADPPYQVDMISRFYRFNIHSPIVFIPLVLKNAQ